MNRCPKCGSTSIAGPRFVTRDYAARFVGMMRTAYGSVEALRYTCAVCGFMIDEPTKDAK